MLDQFNWVVVEANHLSASQHKRLQRYGTTAFAYVSIGEADTQRQNQGAPQQALVAKNKKWNSKVANLANPKWRNYIVNQRIRPLWKDGYRAFFLDTLNSYRLFTTNKKQVKAQQAALISLIKRIHRTFPGIKLLLNRGFGILNQVHNDIVGVAAESLYRGWDAKTNSYHKVDDSNRKYLLKKLKHVQQAYGLPAIAIDYVPPANRQEARATAHKIAADGIIPWVTDAALNEVGIGSIKPMPRKILVLYDKQTVKHGMFAYSDAHRYAAMPLEYLGYGIVYKSVTNLPRFKLRGRYAGIVTWYNHIVPDASRYRKWLKKRIEDGVHVAMLGDPGIALSGALGHKLGLEQVAGVSDHGFKVVSHDDMLGFEGMPKRAPTGESGYHVASGSSVHTHLTLKDGKGKRFSPVVTGLWGGIALAPWDVQTIMGSQSRWILNPFKFFRTALDLPKNMPVPDATTENGSRYWMTEIDGDGFASKANFPGSPFAGQVLMQRILKHYRVPTTASIIQGEIGPTGLHPKLSPKLEAIARKIFRLPWVEIGTHTYSHPFNWEDLKQGEIAGQGETKGGWNYNLPIKGYHFSLKKEVAGSTHYINNQLAPPGKKVQVIQWSGDALPPKKAVTIADRIGIANINGGNTNVTNYNPSITHVSAMLRPLSSNHIQVYSPETNEDIYTHGFKGPIWGYRRVIETYKLTNAPRRLKPIDIYYHFYSATKPASLHALEDVYNYVEKQQTLPIYASQYSQVARNWYHVGIARTLDGAWQITGATHMRTLRLPRHLGWPNIASSKGVVGVRDIKQGRYVALSGADRDMLRLDHHMPRQPYIERANGRVTQWQGNGRMTRLKLKAEDVPLKLTLGGMSGCHVQTTQAHRNRHGGTVTLSYQGPDSAHVLVRCGQ